MGEYILGFVAAMGIPTTIMGLLVWFLKRHIDKKEKVREQREANTEKLMLMMFQNGRAAIILAEATARAVQRIPDAHCNGDMTAALEKADKLQKEEQDFLLDQGIQRIFGD